MLNMNRRRFLLGASALAAGSLAAFDLKALAQYGPEWKTPQDYGAKGDGWTDDRQAFQAAINSGYPVYVPWAPAGYVLGSRLTAIPGTVIEGSLKKPLLKLNSSDWLVELMGSDISVSRLRADFNHLSGAGAILLRSDQTHLERIDLKDLLFSGPHVVLQDLPSSIYRIVLMKIADILAYGVRGPGVFLSRSFAYQYVERVNLLYNGVPNPVNIGWYQYGNEGGFFKDIDVTSGVVTPYNSGAHAFNFVGCKALWMENLMADMVGGGGFVFEGCEYGYGKSLISSMVGTVGLAVYNSGRMSFSGCNVGGRAGMAYAPNHPAVSIVNSPGTILDDACRVYASVGIPVAISGSSGARSSAVVQ